jgi:hypothetical protein
MKGDLQRTKKEVLFRKFGLTGITGKFLFCINKKIYQNQKIAERTDQY